MLSEYHDGALDGDERVWVRTHLETCSPCADIFGDLGRIVLAARELRAQNNGIAYPDETQVWLRLPVAKRTVH
jgi:predicted anti-sigma-YlaC factor YlaD